jgi:phytoene dehydrogenase-like protein
MRRHDVIVVGGGLAGLTCALHLYRAGFDVVLCEASDRVGGRVRTDVVEGFRLDRGFQVLLQAYPETRSELDYERLDLQRFVNGARIRIGGRFVTVRDPIRHPLHVLETLRAPVGTLADKLKMVRMRISVGRGTIEELFDRPETTTREALRDRYGFSESMIDVFFRPFIGGVTFDESLGTSSRMLDFLMRMFSQGGTALPAAGMEAIPLQIAEGLPPERILFNRKVTRLEPTRVHFADGEHLSTRATVVACEAPEAAQLVGPSLRTRGRSSSCLYFVAPKPPFEDPILVVNGDEPGPVLNLSVQTNVAPSYARDDRALIAVVLRDSSAEASLSDVTTQLRTWYGRQVDGWRHLKTYRIPYALPSQTPPMTWELDRGVKLRDRLYICGDYRNTGSINGAMASGRHAARAVAADLQRSSTTRHAD